MLSGVALKIFLKLNLRQFTTAARDLLAKLLLVDKTNAFENWHLLSNRLKACHALLFAAG